MAQRPDTGVARWAGAWACGALFVVAVLRDRAIVGDGASNVMSLIVLGIAFGQALLGPDRLRRVAEVYLWVAFVVTLALLDVAAESLGAPMAQEPTGFRILSVIHVILTAIALGVLGAWSPRGASGQAAPERKFALRFASGLLILAAVVFWVGARGFPGGAIAAIAADVGGHTWTAANFLIAIMLTLPALGLLTSVLRRAGDRSVAVFGFGAVAFGSVFWVLHLAFRLTVVRQVAEDYAVTNAVPMWFDAMQDWSGLLFGLFSLLAYIGIVAYGVAVVRTRRLPVWAGWLCIGLGVALAPLFGPPLFIYVLLWLLGLAVLTRQQTATR